MADFPVPNGREEEWRFTPVKALKALFADEAGTETPKVDAHGPEGVVVRDDRRRRGQGAHPAGPDRRCRLDPRG